MPPESPVNNENVNSAHKIAIIINAIDKNIRFLVLMMTSYNLFSLQQLLNCLKGVGQMSLFNETFQDFLIFF